ncbi:MAG: type IX secretion system membrane protein PorP/SprF [Cytophagales bacterium]
MFRKVITSIIIFHSITHFQQTLAQSDPQFSQYMFVNEYVNPASTAIDNRTNLALLFRYQWAGSGSIASNTELNGSPVTQLLIASTKIKQVNSGVGTYIMNETLGPLSNINAKFNYAYHFDLGKSQLGVGIGIGIYNQGIDFSKFIYNTPNDPVISYLSRNENKLNYDINAGVFYKSKNYFIGASSFHLNTPIYNDSTKAFISRQYFFTAGATIPINELFVFSPTVLIKTNFISINQANLDISTLLKYNNELLWAGLSYRSGIWKPDALVAIIGVGITQNNALKVGYAFDLTVLGNAAKAGTSHEIMLSYSKPVQDILPKPIIRTPRYRF